MSKFEPKMMVMIADMGSKRLEFSTVLSQKEFSELILETNRIFSFAVRTWDSERGNAVIELVPGNGMAFVAPGVGWEKTDQSPENLEIAREHQRASRKFYMTLLHAIGRSIDESPALPPEGPELG